MTQRMEDPGMQGPEDNGEPEVQAGLVIVEALRRNLTASEREAYRTRIEHLLEPSDELSARVILDRFDLSVPCRGER